MCDNVSLFVRQRRIEKRIFELAGGQKYEKYVRFLEDVHALLESNQKSYVIQELKKKIEEDTNKLAYLVYFDILTGQL